MSEAASASAYPSPVPEFRSFSMLNGKWADFAKRHTKLTALGGAATMVIVGLSAFALVPHGQSDGPEPVRMVSAQPIDTHASPPRMLESGAPFSFADLVERVSPAVVTITAIGQETAQDR